MDSKLWCYEDRNCYISPFYYFSLQLGTTEKYAVLIAPSKKGLDSPGKVTFFIKPHLDWLDLWS